MAAGRVVDTSPSPELAAELVDALGLPLFVKPVVGGSSYGVSRVTTTAGLMPAVADALAYCDSALVEQELRGREIDLAVLEMADGSLAVSPSLEIISDPTEPFFSTRAKYASDRTRFLVPAPVETDLQQALDDLARRAFRALGCAGLARVDCIVDQDRGPVVNEVNTFPGFTERSQFPRMWAAAGVAFPELVDLLITTSLARVARNAGAAARPVCLMVEPASVVLLSDPRIGAIGVAASGEPLVRLRPTSRLSIATLPPPAPIGLGSMAATDDYAHVRHGLAERLTAAAAMLPRGLRLHVVEGYRPAALQHTYFEAYRQQLLARIPTLTSDESHRLASRFVAPLDVAAHTSGAAVDITLVDLAGEGLDMGTPIDATPEASDGACYFGARRISAAARTNRDLLATCLAGAGLVNYPTEWWHWSYGDRYWAFTSGHPTALYGPVASSR